MSDPGPAAAGGPPDLLTAEPAVISGLLIGYGRVSTRDQHLDRQITALNAAGCARIFTDKLSGADAARPELVAALDYARPGDTLVVLELARLGRSLTDLIRLVGDLRTRGIGFRSLHEALDTTTPGGRLVFHVFAALAEFVRELIVAGTHEGLDAARARGQRLGRPPAMSAEKIRQARAMLERPEESVSSIARLLGVSRSTLYRHVPELKGDAAPAGRELDDVLATLPADTRPDPDLVVYDQLLSHGSGRQRADVEPGQVDGAAAGQREGRSEGR